MAIDDYEIPEGNKKYIFPNVTTKTISGTLFGNIMALKLQEANCLISKQTNQDTNSPTKYNVTIQNGSFPAPPSNSYVYIYSLTGLTQASSQVLIQSNYAIGTVEQTTDANGNVIPNQFTLTCKYNSTLTGSYMIRLLNFGELPIIQVQVGYLGVNSYTTSSTSNSRSNEGLIITFDDYNGELNTNYLITGNNLYVSGVDGINSNMYQIVMQDSASNMFYTGTFANNNTILLNTFTSTSASNNSFFIKATLELSSLLQNQSGPSVTSPALTVNENGINLTGGLSMGSESQYVMTTYTDSSDSDSTQNGFEFLIDGTKVASITNNGFINADGSNYLTDNPETLVVGATSSNDTDLTLLSSNQINLGSSSTTNSSIYVDNGNLLIQGPYNSSGGERSTITLKSDGKVQLSNVTFDGALPQESGKTGLGSQSHAWQQLYLETDPAKTTTDLYGKASIYFMNAAGSSQDIVINPFDTSKISNQIAGNSYGGISINMTETTNINSIDTTDIGVYLGFNNSDSYIGYENPSSNSSATLSINNESTSITNTDIEIKTNRNLTMEAETWELVLTDTGTSTDPRVDLKWSAVKDSSTSNNYHLNIMNQASSSYTPIIQLSSKTSTSTSTIGYNSIGIPEAKKFGLQVEYDSDLVFNKYDSSGKAQTVLKISETSNVYTSTFKGTLKADSLDFGDYNIEPYVSGSSSSSSVGANTILVSNSSSSNTSTVYKSPNHTKLSATSGSILFGKTNSVEEAGQLTLSPGNATPTNWSIYNNYSDSTTSNSGLITFKTSDNSTDLLALGDAINTKFSTNPVEITSNNTASSTAGTGALHITGDVNASNYFSRSGQITLVNDYTYLKYSSSASALQFNVPNSSGSSTMTALSIANGGATTFSNTVTVGANDTGYDVKFFGATSGAYMLWEESTDDLKLVGGAGLVQSGSGANTLTGATTINNILTVGNNIVSDTDGTADLGTTSVRWANVYTDSIGDTGQALAVAATELSFNGASTIDTSGNNALTLNSGTANLNITAGTVAMGTNATVGGTLGVTGVTTVGGNIVSDTNNVYSLGVTGTRWANVFATSVTGTNAYVTDSDLRLKENIHDEQLGLEFINDLRPVTYTWKTGEGSVMHGLIAQEVEETLQKNNIYDKKQIIDHDEENDKYSLKYSELIAPLIKSVQELKAENDQLKARLEALENK